MKKHTAAAHFLNAVAVHVAETFVECVRTRALTERSGFAAALEAELLAWQEDVPETAFEAWPEPEE